MLQPNKAQWRVLWAVAILLLLVWPSDTDRSLGLKVLSWLADPMNSLPSYPSDLSMADGDDVAAVNLHDQQVEEYDKVRESSKFMRLRFELKELYDPFNPATERQLLAAGAVLGALVVWRLGGRKEKA